VTPLRVGSGLVTQSKVDLLATTHDHAIDTYVLCLSQHLRTDDDGVLSMWRGYMEAVAMA
jgi:hypothetical protein